MRSEQQPYKMSFAVGGLALTESIEVARLRLGARDWDDTIVLAMADGVTSLPKAASRRRTLREIINRLSELDLEELAFFVDEADRTEQQALLWLASPWRASTFFWRQKPNGMRACPILAGPHSSNCAR